MSDVDNDNETDGVDRSESGCNDGVGCAHSGCCVGALRRGASEERVDVELRKKRGQWCGSIVTRRDNHDNGCGDVARRVWHATRGGKPGRASGIGIAGARSVSSTYSEALSVNSARQQDVGRLQL